jgi:hypothetical protein
MSPHLDPVSHDLDGVLLERQDVVLLRSGPLGDAAGALGAEEFGRDGLAGSAEFGDPLAVLDKTRPVQAR